MLRSPGGAVRRGVRRTHTGPLATTACPRRRPWLRCIVNRVLNFICIFLSVKLAVFYNFSL